MKLLDAFACEGGAGYGYELAGFQVTPVDLSLPRLLNHPAIERGVVADAVVFIREHGHEFDLIHASPPCQRFTHGNAGSGAADKWPDLIGPTRDACESAGRPYVIENVPRAPLLSPMLLCGSMFGLGAIDDDGTALHLQRHRLFESNLPLRAPRPCVHPKGAQWAGVYGGARRDKHEARNIRKGGYVPPSIDVLRQLIGAPWMTERGLFESIPPAYARHIGNQARDLLRSAAA